MPSGIPENRDESNASTITSACSTEHLVASTSSHDEAITRSGIDNGAFDGQE
jgi:hypothetical protein